MTKFCPICRSKYEDSFQVCPADGMKLFIKADRYRGKLIVGRYQLQDKIGSGGMSYVFKAEDRLTGEMRAVKMLRPHLAMEAEQRVRFLREAKAARAAEHPNIVRMFELGETADGNAFMVMEYIEGETVGDAVRRGTMPLAKILDICEEICLGLEKAHSVGVLHRDIKPDNVILLDSPGDHVRLKILDFGLARMKGDLSLTDTGQVFGTPEYISPEQATGADATTASDQYSTGILFYEMLTGRPPFLGPPAQVMLAQFKRVPVPPSMVKIDRPVPSRYDDVVLRMLAKRPLDRYSDMSAVREALSHLRKIVGER